MLERHQTLLGAALVFIGAIAFSTKAIMVKLAYQYQVDAVSFLDIFAFGPVYLAIS